MKIIEIKDIKKIEYKFDISDKVYQFDNIYLGIQQDKIKLYGLTIPDNFMEILRVFCNKTIYVTNTNLTADLLSLGFIQEKECLVYHFTSNYQFKSYYEATNYINNLGPKPYELVNFKAFNDYLGNPSHLLKTIHIGGTNGKGSTTSYLLSVLCKSGYKVGSFTTPALLDPLEIIRVNNQIIDESIYLDYLNSWLDLFIKFNLSLFEMEVFICFLYFLDQDVDFALIEVGMGGLKDATNVISPLVCLNTNIGLDHQAFLGNSYQEITYQKVGIVKEGIDLITSETKEEVLSIFNQVCQDKHSKLIEVEPVTNLKIHPNIEFDYYNLHFTLQSHALYQIKNSSLAIKTIMYLKDMGYWIDDKYLIEGIKEAIWLGRFEIISSKPKIILDGAHNIEGIKALKETMKEYNMPIKIIFSALQDKEPEKMIQELFEISNDIILTSFKHIRFKGLDYLKDNGLSFIEDYEEIFKIVDKFNGLILITGSLYFLQQIRPLIIKRYLLK